MAESKRVALAGGCFWCTESLFAEKDGILEVNVGYTGGTMPNPSYQDIGSGTTGHFEAAEVIYDPAKITYADIVDIFFRNIDPTDDGGQFYDRGSQYRTAVFYSNATEQAEAEAIKAKIAAQLGKKVVTQILPVAPFYHAEEYHQEYYKKNPTRYKLYESGSRRKETIQKLWESSEND